MGFSPPSLFPRPSGAIVRLVRPPNVAGWLFVAFVAVAAEAAVRLLDLHDSVPTPSATLRALGAEVRSGELPAELATTLESYVVGFGLAAVLGVGLGAALGASRLLRDASSVTVEFLRPIPGIAIIPVAMLAFGLGEPMRRFVIAYAALWPILVYTAAAVRGTDSRLHDVARTNGVDGSSRLVRVSLPAALPGIATGIRVSASIALLVAVTVEFVTGTDGLGAYMQQQQLAFRLPELYAALVVVGLLGYAVNIGLRALERRAVPWSGEQRAALM